MSKLTAAVAISFLWMVGCDVARDRTFDATTSDSGGVVTFEAGDPSLVKTSNCTCPQSIPGPDGGTRNLVKNTCYNSSICQGTCTYPAWLPNNPSYTAACLPNEGNESCDPPCPPPPLGYWGPAAQCSSAPKCGGICVWADPAV